jgi:phosphoglycerate kinase
MEKELRYLGMALEAPERPFVAVLGGAKVSDKIQVIESLLPRVDALLVGGGMAYTFFKAQGLSIGKSLVEADKIELAKALLAKAGAKAASAGGPRGRGRLRGRCRAPDAAGRRAARGLDGPRHRSPDRLRPSPSRYGPRRSSCGTAPWASFEMKPFAQGTLAMARALAESKGTTIVGGGDSVAAVTQMGLADEIDMSRPEAAPLSSFSRATRLPGVACLEDA